MKYGSLYIKKERDGAVATDTITRWSLGCVKIPFKVCSGAKKAYVRSWKDEHGEDAYVSDGGLFLEAYDLKLDLCYKGDLGSAYGQITDFGDYLSGADGSGVMMSVYDPVSGMGRRHVRMVSFADGDLFVQNGEDELEFSVTLRVGDPVTDVVIGE